MKIFKNMLANECVWDKQRCANDLWKDMIMRVRKVVKEGLGESKGYIRVKKRPGGGIIMFKRKLNSRNSVLKIYISVIMRKIESNID